MPGSNNFHAGTGSSDIKDQQLSGLGLRPSMDVCGFTTMEFENPINVNKELMASNRKSISNSMIVDSSVVLTNKYIAPRN